MKKQDALKNRGLVGRCAVWVLFALLLGLATDALAGWKLVERQAALNQKTTMYVDGDRVVTAEDDGIRIILGDGMISLISDQTKTYWKGTQEDYRKSMCEFTKSVWEMTGHRPEAAPVPRVTVEKLGMTRVAGYKAEGFRILADGKLFQEIWINRDSRLKELDAAWRKHQVLNRASVASACGLPLERDAAVEESAVYRKLYAGGFVIKSSNANVYGGGFSYDEMVSIEKMDVKKALFEVPSGYRRLASVEEFMRQPAPADKQASSSMPRMGMPGGQMPEGVPPGLNMHVPGAGGETQAGRGWVPPAGDDDTSGDEADEERGHWGAGQEQEKEPESVRDQIKKGVGGLLKSIF